jgi:hypothetical protein
MAVVFKYKHPCSYEYAPGFVNIGVDGEQGERGIAGNAVYFTDTDLDNSYNIELALQQIENNYILSSTKINQLKGRTYKVNDILLSSNGKCYRLIESNLNSLFKNYKFDIEFLGSLHKSSFNNATRVIAYDFTNSKIYDANTNELLKEFPSHTYSPVPTTRVEDDFFIHFYNESRNNLENMEKYFSLYGIWIKFVVLGNTGDDIYYDSVSKTLTGVKYSLTVNLKNEKTLQGNSAPFNSEGEYYNEYKDPVGIQTTENLAVFESYVPMEFSNICICDANINISSYPLNEQTSCDDNTAHMLEELIVADTSKPESLPSYISDYSMDMLHPSGNNIKCTLDRTGAMWAKFNPKDYERKLGYNSYVREEDEIKYRESFPKNVDPEFDYDNIGKGLSKGTVCEDSEEFLDNIGVLVTDNKSEDTANCEISPDKFPTYAAGLGVSAMNKDHMQKGLDDGTLYSDNDFIVGSTLQESNVSQTLKHPGESMYFSSIISTNDIPNAIKDYIFNENNIFTLTSKDNKTKECIINDLSISINNDFNNKNIYVTRINGKIVSVETREQ